MQFTDPAPNATPAPAPLDWRRNFLCTIKATDIAIAGFGLFLVLSIVFQSLFQGVWMRRMLAGERTRVGTVGRTKRLSPRSALMFSCANSASTS